MSNNILDKNYLRFGHNKLLHKLSGFPVFINFLKTEVCVFGVIEYTGNIQQVIRLEHSSTIQPLHIDNK